MIAEEKDLIELPDELSYSDGAQVACGFGTAYEGLSKIEVSGDHVVLVVGLGPVGLSALMLAKAMGASRLIGVDVSEFRAKLCRAKGLADNVILGGRDDTLEQIMALTKNRGCERVVDASGSDAGRQLAIQATRDWGRCVLIGENGKMTFQPSADMLHGQKTLYGSWVTSLWQMEDLVERLARWNVHPEKLLTHRFPLEKAHDAYALMASGYCGKVGVCFDEELIGGDFTPAVTLYTGAKLPSVGLGTFGSDPYSTDEVASAVEIAIDMGYRHMDCAAAYHNEVQVGKAIKRALARNQLEREDIWITSKLWNDEHNDVISACKKSIADLDCGYLDLYMVHGPLGCTVHEFDADAHPRIHEKYMSTWRQMEELVSKGLVKNIGTSNVTIPKMELILKDATIKPAVNVLELHPHFQQPKLYDYLVGNNVQPIGFRPICTPDDTADMEDPVVVELAEKYKVHPGSICVAWAVRKGAVTIPQSRSDRNIRANLVAATFLAPQLTDEDMNKLATIDKHVGC
jgi:diketogulonate reductase-like aldo/keto reductase